MISSSAIIENFTYPKSTIGIPAIAALIKNEIPGAYFHAFDNPSDQE